ncbi:MAG: Tail Collar domain protein [Firmicutes bacterium]|nr:Tail Collar domain protein [Bacillota bacterium]
MTVSNTVTKNTYTLNSATTEFSYTFVIDKYSDIHLYLYNSSERTTTEITSGFTVDTSTATVTYSDAANYGSTYKLILSRELELTQDLDLINQGAFYADEVENELDRLMMIDQQIQEELGRSLKVPISCDTSVSTVLPIPVADKSFVWDTTGTALVLCDSPATAVTAAAASATAAAASESNAATSATSAANSATEASTSAINAANSATAAADSATAAATSESNAATSATDAANSATAASTSETNSATSESNAATSTTRASSSATAASTSETNSATSATSAASSAESASTYATNAANSATAAATSATAAATSESNAADSATAAAANAASAGTAANPTGVILPYGGSSAPDGYLLCDGSTLSRTTYANLYDVVGTTYGTGDGSTTFALPDLQDKFVLGKGDTYSTLAATGGETEHTLTTDEMPSHHHTITGGTSGTAGYVTMESDGNSASTESSNGTNYTGGGEAHNNMPPYIVLNYIIKY